MPAPILTTKVFVPPPRVQAVCRPRLNDLLDGGLHRKLTLVSAPAGFGKTTLVSECCHRQNVPVAWLSLGEQDSDPARFLTYFVAALQTIFPRLGQSVLTGLQAPQPPPAEAILTVLMNELAAIPGNFIFVLDDYHLVDDRAIDDALFFLVEHAPPQMHLVIVTREDPQLPLSQLRARDQLTELRAADLRFTLSEAAEFLNRVMGLNLSAQDIAALEMRTEGWVAGLQLAALGLQGHLSMRGQGDTENFIRSFTGSNRFVLDYMLEQVLEQQAADIQTFLLCTSIFDRLCGPLCDAVLQTVPGSSHKILADLERANLFIFPLDDARHWYRYHHLFADLLRQRLQNLASSPEASINIAELHRRASAWYENNDLIFEAFHHATGAKDIDRAERLIETGRMPIHYPGAVRTILDWLGSLPETELDARPALWARFAFMSLVLGISTGVDEKLLAAEAALHRAGLVPDGTAGLTDRTRNFIGQIATARATLALTRYQIETIIVEARRALEFLDPENFSFRASAYSTLGLAYYFQGERAAARRAFKDALSLGQSAGSTFDALLATSGLGSIQASNNELDAAVETYRRVLRLAGEPALSIAHDAHLGLARIFYEWNDLDTAQQHAQASLELARQYDTVIDQYVVCQVFLARLKLAQGDANGASVMLARIEQKARENNFVLRLPEIAGAQVLTLLRLGDFDQAALLAQSYDLPPGIQARVLLAQGNALAAMQALESFRQFVEAKGWADEQLKTMVLQTITLDALGQRDRALQLLGETLPLAQPGGFIRLFVDEGKPMQVLLADFRARLVQTRAGDDTLRNYADKLLAVFAQSAEPDRSNINIAPSALIEPLSERELEILKLIVQGYSNQEIGERLFLALSTVKGHNRNLFDKLQVKNRTEAAARARALGLL